jgi:hypothetical protein
MEASGSESIEKQRKLIVAEKGVLPLSNKAGMTSPFMVWSGLKQELVT